MSPKIKEELLKIALAMREARRYERKQKALARNARQESSETADEEDTLERAAREWAEAQKRRQGQWSREARHGRFCDSP